MSLRALYDLPAPAKLNLFLHVTGRRDDGYHLLQSVFVMIDWADEIHLERRDDGRLQRHDLGPALPADDLCLRAARALQAASGSAMGADISIAKHLPWGAGMGGGSSDAATVLIALNRLWGLGWSRGQLQELGATLGADIPFFVGGRNALVEGIGEKLSPLTLDPTWFAVVKPAQAISTAEIFGSPLVTRNTDPAIVAGLLERAGLAGELNTALTASLTTEGEFPGRNDLQNAAESLCPQVAEVAEWLRLRWGNSRMTGSGSAVFARAGTGDHPVATWPEGELPPGWVGRMCRSLDHHPLREWVG